jgi:hypothetical protein
LRQRKLRAVNDQAQLSCGLVSNSDPLQESKQLKMIQHKAQRFQKKKRRAQCSKKEKGNAKYKTVRTTSKIQNTKK